MIDKFLWSLVHGVTSYRFLKWPPISPKILVLGKVFLKTGRQSPQKHFIKLFVSCLLTTCAKKTMYMSHHNNSSHICVFADPWIWPNSCDALLDAFQKRSKSITTVSLSTQCWIFLPKSRDRQQVHIFSTFIFDHFILTSSGINLCNTPLILNYYFITDYSTWHIHTYHNSIYQLTMVVGS